MRTINFTGKITTLEPLTVIQKSAVTSSGHRLPRNGGPSADPYFPATSIRGVIRRLAHQVVVERVTAENDGVIPFDLADHFMLAQGIDIADRADTVHLGEINAGAKIRACNPLLSLFGRWKLAGKVGIGNALPTDKSQWTILDGGARTVMFERDDSLIELLEPDQVARLERILTEQADASIDVQSFKREQSVIKEQLKTAEKEDVKELRGRLHELDEKIKARKKEKSEAHESIRRPLDPYEAFIPGAELSHRMVIKDATDVEAGLFVEALIRFASNPRLGSHRAYNCGLVAAEWQLSTWKPGELKPVSIGEVSITPHGVKISGDEIENMVKSFKESKELDFSVC
ncbi:CRISPR-associated protein Csf2 [Salmonella enterica subsp. enterica serovar Carswell]|nr:CRISPR-associated protein Csf2 [Salmonella enterica subsp. enterica serovar Mississippi]EJT9340269.1 CRISPR-associated protein Csf2 [Salmonella enterica]EKA9974742.1 CRISPR-associated protein Csf2 [Salmonella enterica subsp. enterica]